MGIVMFGLSYGLSDGLIYGLIYGLEGLNSGLIEGLASFWSLFVVSSILLWAVMGGLAVWRHYLIRFLLRRTQTFPWNAPRFLEDATIRILLRRLGGGYHFTHRLLLDSLADNTA
jgi:hypothetical protein